MNIRFLMNIVKLSFLSQKLISKLPDQMSNEYTIFAQKYAPFEYKPPNLNRKCTAEVFTIYEHLSIISPSLVLKPESYCKWGAYFQVSTASFVYLTFAN